METLNELVKQVGNITTPSEEISKKVVYLIRKEIKEYVENNNLQSLVLGVSGGLDSAVVAALCQEKYTGVPLIGISIPMSSSTEHKEQAQWVGENFCSVFEEFTGWDTEYFVDGEAEAYNCPNTPISDITNITSMTNKLAENAGFNSKEFPENILEGNIKARMRMITLMDLSRKCNGMVLGTGQRSEDEYMKFFTLGGDDRTDFDCIHNIGKGFELPAIAKFLEIREDIISQPPSDGLRVSEEDTDEAQLGANYQEIDTIMGVYLGNIPVPDVTKNKLKARLFNLIETDLEGAKKVAKVINRYETFKFKFNGTVYLTREQIGLN